MSNIAEKMNEASNHPALTADPKLLSQVKLFIALGGAGVYREKSPYHIGVTANIQNNENLRGLSPVLDAHLDEALKHDFTQDDVPALTDILLDMGYLTWQYTFFDENGEDLCDYTDMDAEDLACLEAEIKKSQDAAAACGGDRGCEAYQDARGEVWNPESGADGYDPFDHVAKTYQWTNKLALDKTLIRPSRDAIEQATDEILTDDMRRIILERAREITWQNLKS